MELTRTLAGDAEREVRETTVVDRRPFRLDGIEYSYAATVDRRTVPLLEDHPAFEFSIVPESDRKATRIRIDSAGPGERDSDRNGVPQLQPGRAG